MKVYTCAEWHAEAPGQHYDRTDPDGIVIHHTAGPNRALIANPDKAREYAFGLAQDIQALHMHVNGWGDTGQNFLVTRDGIVLEGRHGSYAAIQDGQSIRGAHAGDYEANTWPGIEVEGLYTNATPPAVQWRALVELCAWICRECKIQSASIHGHREFVATQCPGDKFFGLLTTLRKDVKAALNGKATVLVKPPAKPPEKPASKVKLFANDKGISAAKDGVLYDVEELVIDGEVWTPQNGDLEIVATLGKARS